jgi:ketosteroid isomerase-like protein
MPSRHIRSCLPLVLALALATPVVARAQIEEPRIPLQTKLTEVNRFRTEYAENYNKKDFAAVVAMYAADAIVIGRDGTTMMGIDQIRQALTKDPTNAPHLVITSDSLAIYGNTAVDVGTTKAHPEGGDEQVSRYMVVLRRDMHGWKVVRVSTTPVSGGM